LNEFQVPNIKKFFAGFRGLSFLFLAIANVVFCFIPLVKYFSYEVAVINAVLITFLSGLSFFRYSNKDDTSDITFLSYLKEVLFLLIIPPTIYFFSSLFQSDCSFLSGIEYYLVFTVPSPIISAGIASVVLMIGIKYQKTVFSIFFILLLFNWVLDLFFYPQFFFYNSIITYYPGVIYDEFIEITDSILIYKLVVVTVSLSLVFFEIYARRYDLKKRLYYSLSSIIVLPIVVFYVSGATGLITLKEDLTEDFKDKLLTSHFLIFSEEKMSNSEKIFMVKLHEYYYEELATFYKVKPKRHLLSVIFKDSKSKKRYLGVENADVAKPWLDQAYTTRANIEKTLKHELAHLFTADFGWGIFQLAGDFNPALIEGAATAAAGYLGGYTIEEFASATEKSKYRTDIEEVFPSFNFFNVNPTLAYLVSGSFCQFIIQKEGIVKFKQFYFENDFEKVYGKPLAVYKDIYEKKLKAQKNTISEKVLDFYFDSKPLIQRSCPRYIAERMTTASDFFMRGDFKSALSIYEGIIENNGTFAPLLGKINCLVLLDRTLEALLAITTFEKQSLSFSTATNLLLLKYNILSLQNDSLSGGIIFKKLTEKDSPDFVVERLNFNKLLLENKINPFIYLTKKPSDKIKIIKSIKNYTSNITALNAIVELTYSSSLLFTDLNKLEDYLKFLNTSSKMKLCINLIRYDKAEEASRVFGSIDKNELNLAEEIAKYGILTDLFKN
jgi:hypothetical protein